MSIYGFNGPRVQRLMSLFYSCLIDPLFVLFGVLFLQLNVMRPPNYTLLMIWLPVILLAFIVGYLKRENLHVIYESKYWAIAAMVCTTVGYIVICRKNV